MTCFMYYCNDNNVKRIESLKNKQDPLGVLFHLLWSGYRNGFLSGCKTYNEIIDDIIKDKNTGNQFSGHEIMRNCTKDKYPHNLVNQYEMPVAGSPLTNPLSLIKYFEDILEYKPSSTEETYTWGDVNSSVIGCFSSRTSIDKKLIEALRNFIQENRDKQLIEKAKLEEQKKIEQAKLEEQKKIEQAKLEEQKKIEQAKLKEKQEIRSTKYFMS